MTKETEDRGSKGDRPGSGIGDGETIGTAAAAGLTGFAFDLLDVTSPRRALLSDTTHPLTRGLGPAAVERTAADGSTWTSVFTTTPGLPAAFWRNAARHAGAHVWCEQDEIVMADAGLVALHSIVGGRKTLLLPGPRRVVDVVSGGVVSESADRIEFDMQPPETRVFRITPAAGGRSLP